MLEWKINCLILNVGMSMLRIVQFKVHRNFWINTSWKVILQISKHTQAIDFLLLWISKARRLNQPLKISNSRKATCLSIVRFWGFRTDVFELCSTMRQTSTKNWVILYSIYNLTISHIMLYSCITWSEKYPYFQTLTFWNFKHDN